MASEQRQRRSNAYEGPLFDTIDRQLLEELGEDGRLTMAELGRRVNLCSRGDGARAATRASRRHRRLPGCRRPEGDRLSDRRGRSRPPGSRQLHRIPEVARETPEVVECYRITGEDCFFLKLHLRSIDDLEEILDRFVVYGQTTTSIVHSAPIAGRRLPVAPGRD